MSNEHTLNDLAELVRSIVIGRANEVGRISKLGQAIPPPKHWSVARLGKKAECGMVAGDLVYARPGIAVTCPICATVALSGVQTSAARGLDIGPEIQRAWYALTGAP